MLRLFLIATCYALLSACTSPASRTAVAPAAADEPQKPASKAPERAFPADSLYPLLVAEFALRRRAYDVALDNYMTQAEVLRDAGVSAHTTHLTQFLQREREALQASRLWVELEPENVEANSILAALLVRQGRGPEALPHLALVQRKTGEANFPALLNGFNDLDFAQQEALQHGIDELAGQLPANTSLLLTQAMLHTEYEQYAAALDKLDDVLALEPEQPQALLLEARILLARGAKQPFARLERVLRANPDSTQLRLQYARLLTAHDISAARAQFELLSAQSPRDGDLLLSLALINREIGDDLAAGAYLRQLLALEQRMDEAHYYLGRIAEDAGDLRTALAEFRLVAGGREFISANARIGRILIGAGQLQESLAWFDRQRQQHPQQREQLYALQADVLNQSGAPGPAIDTLTQALRELPDSTSLRYARSMLSEQQDDLTAMESDLRAILAREPDNATVLNALGYSLANRTERYTEALELITRALELEPDEPAILDSMGWVLFHTGRYEEALDYLTRAYADFPDPEVAAHLGEVLWTIGNTDAATAIWQGALLKDPDHHVLNETLQRLGVERAKLLRAHGATTAKERR